MIMFNDVERMMTKQPSLLNFYIHSTSLSRESPVLVGNLTTFSLNGVDPHFAVLISPE